MGTAVRLGVEEKTQRLTGKEKPQKILNSGNFTPIFTFCKHPQEATHIVHGVISRN